MCDAVSFVPWGWDIGPTIPMGPSPWPNWSAWSHGQFHKWQPLTYIHSASFKVTSSTSHVQKNQRVHTTTYVHCNTGGLYSENSNGRSSVWSQSFPDWPIYSSLSSIIKSDIIYKFFIFSQINRGTCFKHIKFAADSLLAHCYGKLSNDFEMWT